MGFVVESSVKVLTSDTKKKSICAEICGRTDGEVSALAKRPEGLVFEISKSSRNFSKHVVIILSNEYRLSILAC